MVYRVGKFVVEVRTDLVERKELPSAEGTCYTVPVRVAISNEALSVMMCYDTALYTEEEAQNGKRAVRMIIDSLVFASRDTGRFTDAVLSVGYGKSTQDMTDFALRWSAELNAIDGEIEVEPAKPIGLVRAQGRSYALATEPFLNFEESGLVCCEFYALSLTRKELNFVFVTPPFAIEMPSNPWDNTVAFDLVCSL